MDDVAFVPSLEMFRSETRNSDIDIRIEWMENLDIAVGQQLFDSGSVWRLYEKGSEFQFDFTSPVLGEQPYKRLLVDSRFRRARLQMNAGGFRATGHKVAALEYPLDELLITHRLTQEKGIELHSCGIVLPDGGGNLFVGHSGAGKSTTTRLWTAHEDVQVLSDDRIIVRREECEHNYCASKDGVLRLRDRSALPDGRSAPDDKPRSKMRMYGTPWHGEGMYASPDSAPLARIFVLEHGHGNLIAPLSSSQAVAELFARSFVPFYRHEYVDAALEFLQELVGAVPCYRYSFEPDQRAVDRILDFHD